MSTTDEDIQVQPTAGNRGTKLLQPTAMHPIQRHTFQHGVGARAEAVKARVKVHADWLLLRHVVCQHQNNGLA